jgi:hypothetical protein
LLYNIKHRSSTNIGPLSKLALPGGIDFHYIHILKTETKTNVFWIGESYNLDIWHEMLFGGPVSRLFESNHWVKILPWPRGQWPTFLCFDVQPWNLTMCTVLVVKLNFNIRWSPRFWWCDLLSCPFLSFDVQLWNLNHVHRLRCKVNFDISWPRCWQSVLLCCPLTYSHEIWPCEIWPPNSLDSTALVDSYSDLLFE